MSSTDDRRWFIEQVRAEHRRLRAYVRALGVRAEAVDDLAQDALVIAFEKRADFDRRGDFGAWVRTIARHLIANERRKDSRRKRLLSAYVTDRLLEAESQQRHALASDTESEDLSPALRHCLDKLSDQNRQLLQLRYFENLSPGAIAGETQRSSNAVRQSLFRVRRELLQCLESSMNA